VGVAERTTRYAARPRLLLVHPDSWQRIALAGSLGASFNVAAIGEGAAALALVKPGSFALALSAQRMPEMTGIELLEQLRVRDPAMRRVLLCERAFPGLDGHLASGLLDASTIGPPHPAELRALLRRRRADS
jgi:response regulator RpfG family c-di-GMP phosphodiesterase